MHGYYYYYYSFGLVLTFRYPCFGLIDSVPEVHGRVSGAGWGASLNLQNFYVAFAGEVFWGQAS